MEEKPSNQYIQLRKSERYSVPFLSEVNFQVADLDKNLSPRSQRHSSMTSKVGTGSEIRRLLKDSIRHFLQYLLPNML